MNVTSPSTMYFWMTSCHAVMHREVCTPSCSQVEGEGDVLLNHEEPWLPAQTHISNEQIRMLIELGYSEEKKNTVGQWRENLIPWNKTIACLKGCCTWLSAAFRFHTLRMSSPKRMLNTAPQTVSPKSNWSPIIASTCKSTATWEVVKRNKMN